MARVKFKFSKTIRVGEQSTETFEASEADSWEEARKIVEKGVYDRSLELRAKVDLQKTYDRIKEEDKIANVKPTSNP